jgi:hypothetical protein
MLVDPDAFLVDPDAFERGFAAWVGSLVDGFERGC